MSRYAESEFNEILSSVEARLDRGALGFRTSLDNIYPQTLFLVYAQTKNRRLVDAEPGERLDIHFTNHGFQIKISVVPFDYSADKGHLRDALKEAFDRFENIYDNYLLKNQFPPEALMNTTISYDSVEKTSDCKPSLDSVIKSAQNKQAYMCQEKGVAPVPPPHETYER